MKKYILIALLMIVGFGLTVVFSQDENIEAELNVLVDENLRATQAEELDAMLLTLHSDSPAYQQTKQISETLYVQYDLNYEKRVFRFIGLDGEYALGRFQFCATKIAGPEFQDNCIDTFHVFKQENGNWKIWSMAVLKVEFTN